MRALALGQWYGSTYPKQSTSAWETQSQQYRFSVTAPLEPTPGAGGQTELTATSNGQRLDWYSFDAKSAGTTSVGGSTTIDVTAAPTPARFAGCPAPDGGSSKKAVWTSAQSTPRRKISGGSCWPNLLWCTGIPFIVPLQLGIGTLSRLEAIDVANNFGEMLTIAAAAETAPSSWRLFRISKDQRTAGLGEATDLFFMPAAAGAIAEAGPLEEIRFIRDEMANVAWALEGIVEGPMGPIDRTEREQAGRGVSAKKASREASGGRPVFEYHLATAIPRNGMHWRRNG